MIGKWCYKIRITGKGRKSEGSGRIRFGNRTVIVFDGKSPTSGILNNNTNAHVLLFQLFKVSRTRVERYHFLFVYIFSVLVWFNFFFFFNKYIANMYILDKIRVCHEFTLFTLGIIFFGKFPGKYQTFSAVAIVLNAKWHYYRVIRIIIFSVKCHFLPLPLLRSSCKIDLLYLC